jgi:DNA-binding response OmpR family regulator
MLRKHGHTVLVAHHGQAALDYLEQQRVDLLLLDRAIAEEHSKEVIGYLRTSEQHQNLPVIMLIALGQDRQHIEEERVNAFLSKPTSSRELIDTVHRLLGGRIIGGLH